jgi:hypothetical protein
MRKQLTGAAKSRSVLVLFSLSLETRAKSVVLRPIHQYSNFFLFIVLFYAHHSRLCPRVVETRVAGKVYRSSSPEHLDTYWAHPEILNTEITSLGRTQTGSRRYMQKTAINLCLG